MIIRLLTKQEEIPYKLLLLADETVEAINKYITDSDIYVCEIEDKITASYVLQKVDDETIEMKNIAVLEKYQNQGIGNLLLQDAFKRSIDRKYKTMTIGTGDTSTKPLYIYQKAGFEIYQIKSNYFIDNYTEPIFENGIQLKHLIKLKKTL